MSQREERLRARPEPDTGCAVEYAQHVINAIASIEWAARRFAAGRSPDWDELSQDSLPGLFEHDTHDCDRFDSSAADEEALRAQALRHFYAHIGCEGEARSRVAQRSYTGWCSFASNLNEVNSLNGCSAPDSTRACSETKRQC